MVKFGAPRLAALVAAIATTLAASPATAQSGQPAAAPLLDPAQAIACQVDAGAYIGFSMTLGDDDGGYRARGWIKRDSHDLFLSEYRLPAPIMVAGEPTSTIVFSGSGIAAVLDVADPAQIAARENIVNAIPSREEAARSLGLTPEQATLLPENHLFRGERIVVDTIETAPGSDSKYKIRVVRSISTAQSHPGKTLVGCSYSLEPVD